jgi:hypothetical protein
MLRPEFSIDLQGAKRGCSIFNFCKNAELMLLNNTINMKRKEEDMKLRYIFPVLTLIFILLLPNIMECQVTQKKKQQLQVKPKIEIKKLVFTNLKLDVLPQYTTGYHNFRPTEQPEQVLMFMVKVENNSSIDFLPRYHLYRERLSCQHFKVNARWPMPEGFTSRTSFGWAPDQRLRGIPAQEKSCIIFYVKTGNPVYLPDTQTPYVDLTVVFNPDSCAPAPEFPHAVFKKKEIGKRLFLENFQNPYGFNQSQIKELAKHLRMSVSTEAKVTKDPKNEFDIEWINVEISIRNLKEEDIPGGYIAIVGILPLGPPLSMGGLVAPALKGKRTTRIGNVWIKRSGIALKRLYIQYIYSDYLALSEQIDLEE